MKKSLLVLSVLMAISAMAPAKSQAAVGLYLSSKATAITGGVLTGVAATTTVAIYAPTSVVGAAAVAALQPIVAPMGYAAVTLAVIAPAALVIGVIVLDDNGTGKLQYKEVKSEDALKIGLTAEEISSFNADVDTINALQSQIEREADSIKDFNAEQAATMWNNGLKALNISDNTKAALVKVTAHAVKTSQK